MTTYQRPGWLAGDVDRIVADMTADYDAREKGTPGAMSRSRHAQLDGFASIRAILISDQWGDHERLDLVRAIVTAVDIINKREVAGWEEAE